ncbi:hypothetical protein [Tissierella sp.]|uniref:hypothetical protein n=1 Tax=Tissierella sp. TaxID=41274 RepID=UPI0028AE2082|nr:hypothetical protein [Tissierella sp.]
MRKDYLERIRKENGWFWDSDKKYYLAITDDLDSLLSALLILKYRPNWEIGFYVDFREGIYKKLSLDEDISIHDDNVIGVDWSVPKSRFKCISNHLTQVKTENINSSDINLNIIDGVNMSNSRFDYHKKYNLSTILLVASLLNHKFTSDEARVLSLLPDSSFLGYFANRNYQDYDIQKKYLCNVLEYNDIWECQSQYSLDEFRRFQLEWSMASKVTVGDEGITTVQDVDLELICKVLDIDVELSVLEGFYGLIIRTASNGNNTYKPIDKQSCWSFAVTSKDWYVYSVEVD